MQTLLIIMLGISFLANIAMVVYFIWTLERIFIVTKAGSLKDLLTYEQQKGKPAPVEEDNDMP